MDRIVSIPYQWKPEKTAWLARSDQYFNSISLMWLMNELGVDTKIAMEVPVENSILGEDSTRNSRTGT